MQAALDDSDGRLAEARAELATATEQFSRTSSASEELLSVAMDRVAELEVSSICAVFTDPVYLRACGAALGSALCTSAPGLVVGPECTLSSLLASCSNNDKSRSDSAEC